MGIATPQTNDKQPTGFPNQNLGGTADGQTDGNYTPNTIYNEDELP